MFNYKLSDIIEGGNISDDKDKHFDGKVYFLLKNNEVIYVGQSKSLKARLASHGDKGFDDVSFICAPDHALNDVEAFYIVKFNPELNRSIPSSNVYTMKSKVRESMIEILDDTVAKLIDECEVVYQTKAARNPKYKQKQYINRSDGDEILSKFKKAMVEFLRNGKK